ncbi:MAG: tRNA (adenosine(37)-N6)-threonylcarbamoyltransferase complex ATPase subunit type 1 TsaE [Alphaproteobacteria bacterium]
MSPNLSVSFTITNQKMTEKLAKLVSTIARPQDIISLEGTLGVGKSVFARAFIKNLCGKKEKVPSPTFTLVQTYDYQDKRDDIDKTIWHFDLYRIKTPEEVFELGIEDAFASGISLIEWSKNMGAYLPLKRLEIKISMADDGTPHSNQKRIITITSLHNAWDERLASLKL